MNHIERFREALLLNEVDRLPHGEVMIHDMLVAKILHEDLPGDDGNALAKWMCDPLTPKNFQRHLKAREFLGFDYIHVFPREPISELSEKDGIRRIRDIWGLEQFISRETSEIAKKPIDSPEEVKKYSFPKVTDFDFNNVQIWIDNNNFFVAAQIDTGFFKASQLVGFEQYMEYLFFNKSELHELMEKFTDFQIQMVDKLIDMGVHGIWLSDDHCYNSGPFISPNQMYEFDLKYMKQIVDHIHKRGALALLHCCGNVNYTIEMMIETGVNGIHGFQPTSGNDIYEMKRKYGKQICLLGNLDVNYLLPLGSPFEIDQTVKEMVDKLFFDRTGFILAATNLISSDAPIENAITMHLAAEKYGRCFQK